MRFLPILLFGCSREDSSPSETHPTHPPNETADTSNETTGTADTASTIAPGEWVAIGSCEIWVGPPAIPAATPVPVQCQPAAPAWVSGPVEGWAQAIIRGPYQGDTLGYDMAAVDPDGDGTDALAVGLPHFELPPATGGPYTYVPPENEIQRPRVHLLSDLQGLVWPGDDNILIHQLLNQPSIGESVEALPGQELVLAGDYWQAGYTYVIDASVTPPDIVLARGDEDDDCGADVGVADVDGSGSLDIVAACLHAPLTDKGSIEVYSQNAAGGWQPIATLQGTTPYAWFGRPSVSGFDLDGDGHQDLAIGEEHIDPVYLASAVHLVANPFRGDCALGDIGAITLWNDFPPANLASSDLDGDGVGELVITRQGSPAWSLQPESNIGWVYVVREPPAADSQTSDASWLTFEGIDPEEGFGSGVAMGDFNADGCADVAVGAEGFALNVHNPPGKVYVFHGPFAPGTRSAANADVVLEGATNGDWFGRKLVVGDYNGDGIDDLAIAAIYDAQVAQEAGAVYVLAGVAGAR